MKHASSTPTLDAALLQTPLYSLHQSLRAKFVPFAGYAMPVEFPSGIKQEHLHTRAQAGLFDISHMGQIVLRGETCASALESLVPSRIDSLGLNRQRYTVLTNERGGIIDDVMVTRRPDDLFIVVNAVVKNAVLAHLAAHLAGACELELLDDRALLALQGPAAATVLGDLNAEIPDLRFMHAGQFSVAGCECWINRCGYTGEDGFEISMAAGDAEPLARTILNFPDVAPIGLGARDTLRLEAGLCLSGQDFDGDTSPVEAGLGWLVDQPEQTPGDGSPRFPGARVIFSQLRKGVARQRVGMRSIDRAPVRSGAVLFDTRGEEVGTVTSGAYGATVGGPIAMGYVVPGVGTAGTELVVTIRGRAHELTVSDLPFVPHRYVR
ncbi:MAG: glycine cleavage system aminomethyltransferase GcvT [Gammaproteobacteria bacterium]